MSASDSLSRLDPEACVRLLTECATRLKRHGLDCTPDPCRCDALAAEILTVSESLAGLLRDAERCDDGWKHAAAMSADLTDMARQRDAWREFAEHVAHCVECSQTSYENCDEGSELHAAAVRHPTEGASDAAFLASMKEKGDPSV